MSGIELLREYRDSRSESAFSTLVRRYSGLVYSAARRRVDSGALAEEVVQSVFLQLAQTPPRVASDAALSGWLHRTTLHLSVDLWRSETRRLAREKAASLALPMPDSSPGSPESLWADIAPILDEAVNALPNADRELILLRYFERRPHEELGRRLGISEAATKMRVGRALDRLRRILASQGIACASVLLGAVLESRCLEGVPENLVNRWAAIRGPAGSVAAVSGSSLLKGLLNRLGTLPGVATALGIAAVATAGLVVFPMLSQRTLPSPEPAEFIPRADQVSLDSGFKRAGDALSAAPAVFTGDLDEARRLLRELLQMPSSASSYPSPRMVEALDRFGDQLQESMPILAEAAVSSDYETRVWAFTGIQRALNNMRMREQTWQLEDALSIIRPVLGKALRVPNASGLERMAALQSLLLVPLSFAVGNDPVQPISPDPETMRWIAEAIHTPAKDSKGFRFSILDQLLVGRESDEGVRQFLKSLEPLLDAPSAEDRLVAAYALALAFEDKIPAVKQELLAAIRNRSTYSFRAARVLSRLGAAAVDAVPELLAYAKEAQGWGDGGHADAALESACRLKPELRAIYPEVDRKLKIEERNQGIAQVRVMSFRDFVLDQAESGDEVLLRALTASIQHESDAATAQNHLQGLIQALEREVAVSAGDERRIFEDALGQVRTFEITPPQESTGQKPRGSIGNLLLAARVLLVEEPHSRSAPIEEVLEQFQSGHPQMGLQVSDAVLAEQFAMLSERLRALDPQFRSAWHRAVLHDMPWMDRVLPKLEP